MIRAIRRALRQWKREFLAFWSRFTAFHRIVIGILLAMGVVFLARTRMLDPLERELAAVRKELADKGVPARVPSADADEEVQQELLRAENLRRSIENQMGELAAIEATTDLRLDAGKADAHAALLAMAGRHGLRVLKNAAAEPPAGGTIPVEASTYELAGRFASIYGFLDDVRRGPILWELRDLSIVLLDEGDRPGGAAAPPLKLGFTLVLRRYDGGGK
ncbi:MAG: hypothetical protein ACOX5G_10810 [Kiritimatiellia bacterium]|jgi:hypothetical protein